MDTKRQWTVVTALVALAILAGGYMFLVKPENAKAASLRTKTTTVQGQTTALEAQLAQLIDESHNLAADQAELSKIAQQLPSNPQLPSLLRKLDASARTDDIDLVNVAPSLPVAYSYNATVTPAAKTPAVTTGASPAASASAAPVVSGSTTVPGLAVIPVTITLSGSYANTEQFVDSLQQLDRSMLVNSFSITYQTPKAATTTGGTTAGNNPSVVAPTVGDGELTVTLNAAVFMSTTPLGTITVPPSANK